MFVMFHHTWTFGSLKPRLNLLKVYAIFIVLSKMDYGLIVVLCIAIVAGLLILGNISNRIQERGEKYDIQDRDM